MDVGLDSRIDYRRDDVEGSSMFRNARWLEAEPDVLIEWAAKVLGAAIAEKAKGATSD